MGETEQEQTSVSRCSFTPVADQCAISSSVPSYTAQRAALPRRDIRITPDAQGSWHTIEVSTADSIVHVKREGDAITADGDKVASAPGMIPYGPPALLALAVRAYDPARGGRQALHFLNLPATPLEATIELLGERDAYRRYLLRFAPADQILYVDREGKIALVHNPRENSGFIREGFSALRATALASDVLPPSIKGHWEGSNRWATTNRFRIPRESRWCVGSDFE